MHKSGVCCPLVSPGLVLPPGGFQKGRGSEFPRFSAEVEVEGPWAQACPRPGADRQPGAAPAWAGLQSSSGKGVGLCGEQAGVREGGQWAEVVTLAAGSSLVDGTAASVPGVAPDGGVVSHPPPL